MPRVVRHAPRSGYRGHAPGSLPSSTHGLLLKRGIVLSAPVSSSHSILSHTSPSLGCSSNRLTCSPSAQSHPTTMASPTRAALERSLDPRVMCHQAWPIPARPPVYEGFPGSHHLPERRIFRQRSGRQERQRFREWMSPSRFRMDETGGRDPVARPHLSQQLSTMEINE